MTVLDYPVRPLLWPVGTPYLSYVLKPESEATRRHIFNLRVYNRLLSWILCEAPSSNPLRSQWAIPAEHAREPGSEWSVSQAVSDAGLRAIADSGVYAPHPIPQSIHEDAVLQAVREGQLDIHIQGQRLRGLWRFEKEGSLWTFRKLPDEFASQQLREEF